MASRAFRFKNPVNVNFAPGFAKAGKDGITGVNGENGTAIYFTEYELDNSYSAELALQRVENNLIISNEKNIGLNNRPYKEGDIIISNKMYCYRLIKDTSNSEFSFKFEFLGKIQDNESTGYTGIINIVLYDITGLKVHRFDYDSSTYYNMCNYDYKHSCVTVNNRRYSHYIDTDPVASFDVSIGTCFDNNKLNTEPFNLYGRWYKCVVYLDSLANANDNIYTLKIDLKNNKSFDYYSINGINVSSEHIDPVDNKLLNLFSFNKSIEIPNVGKYIPTSYTVNEKNKVLFHELIDETFDTPTIFLSDMSMDKLHPSNNNFKNLYNDKYYIFSQLDQLIPRENDTVVAMRLCYGLGKSEEHSGSIIPGYIYSSYRHPHNYYYTSDGIDVSIYRSQPVGVDASIFDRNYLNIRPGETAWFSGESFILTSNSIAKFIEDNINNAYIECTNKQTGVTQIINNIKININTEYKNQTRRLKTQNGNIIEFVKETL